MPITTPDSLRQHLQWAIELEHATIPVYLCALYSIHEGTNQPAVDIIRSVVMEEMLHMTLACNLLNAIGGTPAIDQPDFVPSYPTYMPHSDQAFQIHLERFSATAIQTFLRIEQPVSSLAPPEDDHYRTIGQFYAAIRAGFRTLSASLGSGLFSGDPARQVHPNTYYYGGGGEVVAVHDLDTALAAIEEIVEQGEGVNETILDGDHQTFRQQEEVAHYFRFDEIHRQRSYRENDRPHHPTGPPLAVDWTAVYPMRSNPTTASCPAGSELREASESFDHSYTVLLQGLHRAFSGQPEELLTAVGRMYQLKEQAVALMRIPFGETGTTAGPAFEYRP